jgi:hypothetical protein
MIPRMLLHLGVLYTIRKSTMVSPSRTIVLFVVHKEDHRLMEVMISLDLPM